MTKEQFKMKYPGVSLDTPDDIDEARELIESYQTDVAPTINPNVQMRTFDEQFLVKSYELMCEMMRDYEASQGN